MDEQNTNQNPEKEIEKTDKSESKKEDWRSKYWNTKESENFDFYKIMSDIANKYPGYSGEKKPPAIVSFEVYDNDIKFKIDINKENIKTYDVIASFLYLLTSGKLNTSIARQLESKLLESDENYEIFERIINKFTDIKKKFEGEQEANRLVVRPRDILDHKPQPSQQTNPFKQLFGQS